MAAPGAEAGVQAPPADSVAAMGLLAYLTAHAVDDDYERLARSGATRRRASSARTASVVALALFTLLLLTAASQTSRSAVSDAQERASLVSALEARRKTVAHDQDQVSRLQRQITHYRGLLVDNDNLSRGTRTALTVLGDLAGTSPVHGQGVTVTVDDAAHARSARQTVLDTDLQQLVNGLWEAGAEAVAINGQRITPLTAIREAGSAITVNYRSLDRPYVVEAIGDAATLPSRFADTSGGQTWLDLQQQVGLRFSVTTRSSLSLPGAPTPTLRYARVRKGDRS